MVKTMRLVCPNCEAQYEVADGVVPKEGRDVQCSNCNHTWFQLPAKAAAVPSRGKKPHAAADETEAPETAAADLAETGAADTATDATTDAQLQLDNPEPLTATGETDQQRQMLDDSVINILREEAEREARARRVEAETLESQPDLGLSMFSAEDAARSAPEEPPSEQEEEDLAAEIAGEAAEADAAAADVPGAGGRMKMLPDIEQINSTLRAVTPQDDAIGGFAAFAQLQARRRLGFRRGFVLVLVLSMSGLVIYLVAPQLMQRFPAAEPALTSYVANVDRGRIWLDARMRRVTVWMQDEETLAE